jgi:hypothetical protein
MSFIRDTTGLAGAALALFGLYQIYNPLAYVAGGALLCAFAVVWSMKASKR